MNRAIHTLCRLDGGLFNLAHLRSKMDSNSRYVTEVWMTFLLLGNITAVAQETMNMCLCYGNPTKLARSNQQKHTSTTGSVGTFLLIAAYHLSRVFVAQGTYI